MAPLMRASGETINQMDKVNLFIQMVMYIKENGWMENHMDMENLVELME